jgi:hypothetical protein
MSKSTPISQIPNVEVSTDADDDFTVQNILKEIAQRTPASPASPASLSSPEPISQHLPPPLQQMKSQQQHTNSPSSTGDGGVQAYRGSAPPLHQPQQPQQQQFQQQHQNSNSSGIIGQSNNINNNNNNTAFFGFTLSQHEINMTLIVVVACIAAHVLPIEAIVARYIPSIATLAYSDIALKAIAAGCMFFFIRRYIVVSP